MKSLLNSTPRALYQAAGAVPGWGALGSCSEQSTCGDRVAGLRGPGFGGWELDGDVMVISWECGHFMVICMVMFMVICMVIFGMFLVDNNG